MNSAKQCALIATTLITSACTWNGLVSVNTEGQSSSSGDSGWGSLSDDGRYVAFFSQSSELVANDTNDVGDSFVRDMLTGSTIRASVDSTGAQANDVSLELSLSGDGRYLAFGSEASNLIPGDANNSADVFLRDLQTGITTLVSLNTAGEGGIKDSAYPSISRDGRFVSFHSKAENLSVLDDDNGAVDVFVHDRITGETSRISLDTEGNEGNDDSSWPSISGDGRFVAFHSLASNLVAGDNNGDYDVFVHDRQTAVTTRVSVNDLGEEGDRASLTSSISHDGRFITFRSAAENLIPHDTNFRNDIFVHDRTTATTTRVSLSSAGEESNGSSYLGFDRAMSGDNRYIAFFSWGSNLIPDDSNAREELFIHDRITNTTRRASLTATGEQLHAISLNGVISFDGRYVLFDTYSDDLFLNDNNRERDIVLRALPNTSVASVAPNMLPIGATTSVTVIGSEFLAGAFPAISGGQISNLTIVDENTMTLDITIAAGKVSGARDLIVTLPGTGAGPFSGVIAHCDNCVTFF